MMCETPNNALAAEQFLAHFDGMSIGSNDMTQLTLGVDRDSARISELFDERSPAVRKLFATTIEACRRNGKYIGICGEAPSDDMELAEWLVARGIDSISLNPDSVIPTWLHLAKHAGEQRGDADEE
jgi:pyruvate,water dikinase